MDAVFGVVRAAVLSWAAGGRRSRPTEQVQTVPRRGAALSYLRSGGRRDAPGLRRVPGAAPALDRHGRGHSAGRSRRNRPGIRTCYGEAQLLNVIWRSGRILPVSNQGSDP